MEPAPRFVSYNNMIASTGERFVLIVFEAVQPRPIMMHTEGTSSKPHFRPGDIWIRDKTDTRPATKTDLDQMYEPRIDQEASRRARFAFDHLRDQLGPSVLSQAVLATPVPELLIGGRARLQRFAEATIARNQHQVHDAPGDGARDTHREVGSNCKLRGIPTLVTEQGEVERAERTRRSAQAQRGRLGKRLAGAWGLAP